MSFCNLYQSAGQIRESSLHFFEVSLGIFLTHFCSYAYHWKVDQHIESVFHIEFADHHQRYFQLILSQFLISFVGVSDQQIYDTTQL